MNLPAKFTRPFYYAAGFIWDANTYMAADFHGDDEFIRPRGWGRIKYFPNAEATMDKWSTWVRNTVGNVTNPEEAVVLMNNVELDNKE